MGPTDATTVAAPGRGLPRGCVTSTQVPEPKLRRLARTMHTRDVRVRTRPSLIVNGIREADTRGSEMPVGEQVHTDAAPAYAEGAVG